MVLNEEDIFKLIFFFFIINIKASVAKIIGLKLQNLSFYNIKLYVILLLKVVHYDIYSFFI